MNMWRNVEILGSYTCVKVTEHPVIIGQNSLKIVFQSYLRVLFFIVSFYLSLDVVVIKNILIKNLEIS